MNKNYKSQFLIGSVLAFILIPAVLLFSDSSKTGKALSSKQKSSHEPEWFSIVDGNKNYSNIYLLCLSKIKYGTDKASVDSNFAIIRYAESHLPKGAVDDIKSRIFTGNKTYFEQYHYKDDHN